MKIISASVVANAYLMVEVATHASVKTVPRADSVTKVRARYR